MSSDARISSKSNYISKNIFTKNHAIHSILFIFTCAFKFDKSFFLPIRKINVKKLCKENTGFQQTNLDRS